MLLVNDTDISEIAVNCRLKDNWNNGAGCFTFEYPSALCDMFPNGCTVIFTYQDTNLFYGWLFKSSRSRDRISCTAYDQLRYLKANNSTMRRVQTLSSFVNDVCASLGAAAPGDNRMRLGTIDNTEVNLAKKMFDNKSYLDMLYTSIEDNLLLNGYWYTLRDNFGALELRDTYDLRIPLIIGDGSLANDFEYARSIDEDTYNYIKVAKDDKDAGVRNTYVAYDSGLISQWGKLVLYDKVTSEMNEAQLKQRAELILSSKNRETQTLKVDCTGDLRIRGGTGVKVEIAETGLDLWAVVDSVTHNFGKEIHEMTMNLMLGGLRDG